MAYRTSIPRVDRIVINKPRRMNLWVFDTFERRLEAQVAQTTGNRLFRKEAERHSGMIPNTIGA
jgi:hypothetical protein